MTFPYSMNLNVSRVTAGTLPTFTYNAGGQLVDLTSCQAIMTFTEVSTGAVHLTLTSSPANGITLGGTAGTINVVLSAPNAALLTGTQYEYSLQLDFGDC